MKTPRRSVAAQRSWGGGALGLLGAASNLSQVTSYVSSTFSHSMTTCGRCGTGGGRGPVLEGLSARLARAAFGSAACVAGVVETSPVGLDGEHSTSDGARPIATK